jgi:hypothetical protein
MEKLEKHFVPFDESYLLKRIGFDNPCFGYYDAYNGGSHLILKRNKLPWFIKVLNVITGKAEENLFTSQGSIEYEFDGFCLAPTFDQAFEFFRNIDGWPVELWVEPFISNSARQYQACGWQRGQYFKFGVFPTHREAEIDCIRKAVLYTFAS